MIDYEFPENDDSPSADSMDANRQVGSVLSTADEAITEKLHAKKISKKRAANALALLTMESSLSDKQEEEIAADVIRFGFPVSIPALMQYLEDITADQRPDKNVNNLIHQGRERIRRVQEAHAKMGVNEPKEYRDNRSSKPGRA